MGRLTIEYCGEYVPKELCSIDRLGGADDCDLCFEYCKATEEGNEGCKGCAICKCFNKLGEYEDLEEQGKLLKLPCAVGNTIWDNDWGRLCSFKVTGFSFGSMDEGCVEEMVLDQVLVHYTNSSGSITGNFAASEIGKTVFLTREEAEAALKKKRGEVWKH